MKTKTKNRIKGAACFIAGLLPPAFVIAFLVEVPKETLSAIIFSVFEIIAFVSLGVLSISCLGMGLFMLWTGEEK